MTAASIRLFCGNAFRIAYLTTVYLLTAYSMVQLVRFMSWPPQKLTASFKEEENNKLHMALDLYYDLGLSSVFLIVHSLIPKLDGLFNRLNIGSVFRATYVALTNFAILFPSIRESVTLERTEHALLVGFIHFLLLLDLVSRKLPQSKKITQSSDSFLIKILINYWKPVSHLCWSIDLEDAFNWKVLIGFHSLLWLSVFGTALIFDINELIGIKQIYHKMLCVSNPMEYKSPQLRAMYAHLRHPDFSALSLILLTYPMMTIDRLLMCTVFIPYMYFSWQVTEEDYQYIRNNLLRKKLL